MLVVAAFKLTVPLVQVVFGLAFAVMFGNWLTVTSTVVTVDVQPVTVLVPVTVYVVLVVGDTLVVFVFAVVLQLYVSAPDADNVTGLPEHVIVFDAATVGSALTLIVIVSVVVAQPDASPTIV